MAPTTKVVRDGLADETRWCCPALEPASLDDETRENAADRHRRLSAICSHAGCPVTGWSVGDAGKQGSYAFCPQFDTTRVRTQRRLRHGARKLAALPREAPTAGATRRRRKNLGQSGAANNKSMMPGISRKRSQVFISIQQGQGRGTNEDEYDGYGGPVPWIAGLTARWRRAARSKNDRQCRSSAAPTRSRQMRCSIATLCGRVRRCDNEINASKSKHLGRCGVSTASTRATSAPIVNNGVDVHRDAAGAGESRSTTERRGDLAPYKRQLPDDLFQLHSDSRGSVWAWKVFIAARRPSDRARRKNGKVLLRIRSAGLQEGQYLR